MDTAIANMTKNGLSQISHTAVETFVDHILAHGAMTVNGEEKTREDLINMYEMYAKEAFKAAGKKPKASKGTTQGAKPKRVSGYLMFCANRRPALQAEGHDFKTVATKLGEEWASADKDHWNAQAKAQVDGAADEVPITTVQVKTAATKPKAAKPKAAKGDGAKTAKKVIKAKAKPKAEHLDKYCKVWYQGESADDDKWLQAQVTGYADGQYTVTYKNNAGDLELEPEERNIQEYLDD